MCKHTLRDSSPRAKVFQRTIHAKPSTLPAGNAETTNCISIDARKWSEATRTARGDANTARTGIVYPYEALIQACKTTGRKHIAIQISPLLFASVIVVSIPTSHTLHKYSFPAIPEHSLYTCICEHLNPNGNYRSHMTESLSASIIPIAMP